MAKNEKIRVHLVLPEKEVEVEIDDEEVSRTEHLTSEFRDRFYPAYERFSEYVKILGGQNFFSTEILEDRQDQREDIKEIYELTKEAFPEADVLMTEQNSPRNRNEEEFLAYSSDIIIRVCNTNSDAPTITQRIELTDAIVGGSNYPYRHGKYIISTEDSNLAALDLDAGIESWRGNTEHDKLSKKYGFEEGIIQITRKPSNTLFLVSWEDGTTEWINEDVTAGEDAYIRTWEPAVSEQTIYAGNGEGTIYRVDVRDGAVEELTNLDGEIRAIESDNSSLYVTTATEQDKDEESENDWGGSRKSYEFSLLSITNGTIKWTAKFDEAGRGAPRPYLTRNTIVTEANDELTAYDREQGNERWSLSKGDFESKLGLEEFDGPEWRAESSSKEEFESKLGLEEFDGPEGRAESSSGRSSDINFDIKIIDSIEDTIYCSGRASGEFLTAIDGTTGNIDWVDQDSNAIPCKTGVIHEHNGKVVFHRRENDFATSFVALDPESGSEEWQFEAPGRIGCDSSIGTEFVFITSEDCVVFED